MKFNRFLKYLFFLGFLLVLSFLYGFSKDRNIRKRVTSTVIQFAEKEHYFLTQKIVDKLLIQNNSSLIDKPKSVVDLYKLEQQVLDNPYIEKAAVFLTPSGVLKSKVTQRKPVARVLNEKGGYYIDKQGVVMPLSKLYSARVLLVLGLEEDEDITKLLELINVILKDNFFKKEIIGIQKEKTGNYKLSVRSGSYKIDFGSLNNVTLKLKKLKAFYSQTLKSKKLEKYKLISLKYHNQVVCTK